MIKDYKEKISIDLPDMYGFQRKAFYRCLIDNDDTSTTSIQATIKWYKDGVEVIDTRRNIQPYTIERIASNTTLVDMTNGIPVMTQSEFISEYEEIQYDEDGREIGRTWKENTPKHYMGENDFYRYIRDNQPVLLKNLIIQAIERASNII